ncbi:MAG: sugar ABC transporter permease [Lachnospiraceae bacterium]|nr:sugar ABC transporter permease [Lachnospiraceae bacterium]
MKKSLTKHRNLSGFYIAPAMAVLILCLILPLFYTVYCSLFKLDYLVNGGFVGMKNYVTLLTDRKVQDSLLLTLGITLISTLLSVLLGLAMALWIDRKTGFFAYLIEMLGLVPWVISMVVAGLLWRWLFHGDLGLFNMILRMLGLDPIYVVQNKVPAIIALIFVMVWRLVGYAMIMILAGLKGLDGGLIEAAKVDGASPFQLLIYIKLPLIKSSVLLSTIVLTISNFTNNTVPKVLTGGGPSNATNVITLYQYNLGFQYYKFGTSAALSVLIMLITSLIIVLYIKVSNYRI